MLGLWCVIRPVTAPQGFTRPCTRSVVESACSIHDLTIAERFCSVRYSSTRIASGMCLLTSRVRSSTTALPVSVSLSHNAPLAVRRSATCTRDPGLKIVTLSLSLLPVFSDQRSSVIGGKTSCSSFSISFCRCNISDSSSLA